MIELMTVEQVADLLHVKAGTVKGWLRDGKLEGTKVGRKWLVSEAAIQTILARNSNVKNPD